MGMSGTHPALVLFVGLCFHRCWNSHCELHDNKLHGSVLCTDKGQVKCRELTEKASVKMLFYLYDLYVHFYSLGLWRNICETYTCWYTLYFFVLRIIFALYSRTDMTWSCSVIMNDVTFDWEEVAIIVKLKELRKVLKDNNDEQNLTGKMLQSHSKGPRSVQLVR